MQTGAAIVPVFAFGQTPHYTFWRPLIDRPNPGLVPPGVMARCARGLGGGLAWGCEGFAKAQRSPITCSAPPAGCSIVRRIGFVPMLVWGRFGTALPHQVRWAQPADAQAAALSSSLQRSWQPALSSKLLRPPACRSCLAQVPMHVVCGAPLRVPHVQDPSPALVQQHLQRYIAALQALFEKHKAARGHARATLTIL